MLLSKADQDDLPGGRVEFLAVTRTTLQRELLDETGHGARTQVLLWVIEGFFYLDGTNYHEPTFVYAFTFDDPATLNSN